MTQSVSWPAFIKYSGDDELLYISDQAEWLSDEDLFTGNFEAADRLIDSHGQLFSLGTAKRRVIPQSIDERVSKEQVAELLQKHYSVTGACCVAKINLDSLADGMHMLSHDRDA